MQWHLAVTLVFIFSSSAAGRGLKVASKPCIKPGVVVRVTSSHEQLKSDFAAAGGLSYVPMMEEMLGKDYVVARMEAGGACVPSPDGSEPGGVWCFPLNSLRVWQDTHDAREAPVPGKAFKAVGRPTQPTVDVEAPGRNEKPWEYALKGHNLMDPIAPPFEERVDLEKTAMPLPPWLKVKQVRSVECMEKMHEDPHYECDPEDYVNYKKVQTPPKPQKPISKEEAAALKARINHLENTIKSLTPKKKKHREEQVIRIEGLRDTTVSMNEAIGHANRHKANDFDGHNMDIGRAGSSQRMHKVGGYGEKIGQKLYDSRGENHKMHMKQAR